MAWKKLIVGSGAAGEVRPQDLTSEGGIGSGKYLGVNTGSNGLSWQDETIYEHPTYNVPNIVINTGTLSGATVISQLDIQMATDTIGSVTSTTGTVNTRELTLQDLNYTGSPTANNYVHTAYDGDDIQFDTGTLTGATVISQLQIDFETDAEGHVVDANHTIDTRTLTRDDLGYTGSPSPDKYTKWNLEAVNASGTVLETGTMTSESEFRLQAGANCEIVTAWDATPGAEKLTATINAVADYVGHITEVTAGNGMDFTTLNSGNASGAISMGQPSTVTADTSNQFLQGVDGSPGTTPANSTSHTHAVISTDNADANPGQLLKSTSAGKLTLRELEVTNSLVVSGEEVVLGSDNLTIEDNELQINWDTTANAGSGGFANLDSAIIMGHGIGDGAGAKLINTASEFLITDIPANEAAGGSTTAGTAKPVKMGDLTCGTINADSLAATGNIETNGYMKANDYLAFSPSAAPSSSTGRMYYDGVDIWIDL